MASQSMFSPKEEICMVWWKSRGMQYKHIVVMLEERCLIRPDVTQVADTVNQIVYESGEKIGNIDYDFFDQDHQASDGWVIGRKIATPVDEVEFNHVTELNWVDPSVIIRRFLNERDGLSQAWIDHSRDVKFTTGNHRDRAPPRNIRTDFTSKADIVILFWSSHGLNARALTKVLDKCCFEIYTEDEILDRRWYLRERQKRENGIDQDFKDVPGEDPGVGWKRGKIDLWVQETAMKSGISAQDCLALTSLDDYDTLVDDLKKIKRVEMPWLNIEALLDVKLTYP